MTYRRDASRMNALATRPSFSSWDSVSTRTKVPSRRQAAFPPLAPGYAGRHLPRVPIPSAEQKPERTPPAARVICLSLAALSFALHLALALRLDAVGSLRQYDVFFHADTQARLSCVVDGVCDSRASISHPALDLLVNPPVRTLAKIASTLGLWSGDETAARHGIALGVSPVAAAIRTACVYMMLVYMRLRPGSALLGTLLVTVSFSGVLFGAIPESFALSGAVIAAAFAWAARTQKGEPAHQAKWIALAAVGSAITITNLAPVLCIWGAARWKAGEDWNAIARSAARLAISSVAVVALLALVSFTLYDSRPLTAEAGVRYVSKWTEGNDPSQRAAWFPTAAANSVVGTQPLLSDNYQARKNTSRYLFRFTFDDTPGVFSAARPIATVLVVVAFIGGALMLRGSSTQRAVAGASLAILGFNAVLHTFWGVGHFLYSQHWHLAFCLLLIGVLAAPRRFELVANVALVALTLAVLAQNWGVARIMLAHFSLAVA